MTLGERVPPDCQDFARNVVDWPSLDPIEAKRGFPESPFFVVLASGKMGHVVPRQRHGYETFAVETDTVGFVEIETSVIEAPPQTPHGKIVEIPGG